MQSSFWLSLVLFILPIPGFADSKIAAEHELLLAKIQFLHVDFEQEVYSSFRKKTRVRHGVANFAKPNSFQWVFQDDKHGDESFYFDGQTLSHFIKRDNTVTHYDVKTSFSKELQNVVSMVLNPADLLRDFDAKPLDKTPDTTSYQLVPKSSHSDIDQLVVGIPASRSHITLVSIAYKDGNKSTYRFQNPIMAPLSADTFRFKNPGGVKEKRIGS